MDYLLKLAVANGNTTAIIALIVMQIGAATGPVIWRKFIQGRNGNSTIRGLLDQMAKDNALSVAYAAETRNRIERHTERIEDRMLEFRDLMQKQDIILAGMSKDGATAKEEISLLRQKSHEHRPGDLL